LKDSRFDEADFYGRLPSHPETVSVHTAEVQLPASLEQQPQLNSTKRPPDGTSYLSVAALPVTTNPAVANTSLRSRVVCDEDVTTFVSVDHLDRRIILKSKPKLKIMELSAEMFSYSPSFHCLPAIVESLRSDDGPLSDASVASGDGYVADGGHLQSESCQSNASSPNGSVCNVSSSAECDDFRLLPNRQLLTCVDDNLSDLSEKLDTVVSNRQQLSAKSSSDGIDSAVVCTPYSTQTSRDSTDTVDNTGGSCCHSVIDVVDDPAPQPSPSATDELHPGVWENDEVQRATATRTADESAGREVFRKDSNDVSSVTSLKVEWEVGSDSEETPKHFEANVISGPPIEPSACYVHRPFPSAVCSVSTFEEQAREVESHWSDELTARRSCCACLSSVLVRHCVSTAADVTPTISIRLCSSVVDVISLVQRLVVVSSTWLQVVCDSAFNLQRFCQSQDEQFGQETATMCPTSADHAVDNTGLACGSGTSGSVHENLQRHDISEELENVRENRLQQLIRVSGV